MVGLMVANCFILMWSMLIKVVHVGDVDAITTTFTINLTIIFNIKLHGIQLNVHSVPSSQGDIILIDDANECLKEPIINPSLPHCLKFGLSNLKDCLV